MRAASESARGGIGGVVKRLREQRDIDAGVAQRELLELAALPDHVAHAPALRQAARALEHDWRPIDGNHARRPAAGFDRQIALAAARDRRRATAGSRWPSARAQAAQLRPGTS